MDMDSQARKDLQEKPASLAWPSLHLSGKRGKREQGFPSLLGPLKILEGKDAHCDKKF